MNKFSLDLRADETNSLTNDVECWTLSHTYLFLDEVHFLMLRHTYIFSPANASGCCCCTFCVLVPSTRWKREREKEFVTKKKKNQSCRNPLAGLCVCECFLPLTLAHIFFTLLLPGYEIYIFYALCIKLSYFTLWMRKHTFLWIYLTMSFTFCIMPQTSLVRATMIMMEKY